MEQTLRSHAKTWTETLLALVLLFSLLAAPFFPVEETYAAQPAYVEAGLGAQVIITAGSARQAASFVKRVGGKVTSELWLVDAVAAEIPLGKAAELAALPGVRSIVANKTVKSSDWSGWVTDVRIQKSSFNLPAVQHASVTPLPDGGYASVSEFGSVLIFDAGGSLRARTDLTGGAFKSPALVAGDTLYIATENKHLFALDLDGMLRWRYSDNNGADNRGGVVSGPNGHVYFADDRGMLYAVRSDNGTLAWKFNASIGGAILGAPAVGSDGVIYTAGTKNYVFAVNPNGTKRWSFKSAVSFNLSPQVAPNGLVVVASTDGKKVVAIDPVTAKASYTFATAGRIVAPLTIDSDSSLFIATEGGLVYGLNPNGQQRFLFRDGSANFRTSPVLSKDGNSLYAAVEEKVLYALDKVTGIKRWSYTLLGNVKAKPAVDLEGGILLGSSGGDFVRLTADGQLNFRKVLSVSVQQSPTVLLNGDTVFRLGVDRLVTIGRMPESYDGRPDVEAMGNPKIWKLAYPVTIDLGVDQLHKTLLPNNKRILGTGVTIALADTGVYFDQSVKRELGPSVQRLFKGQADFVDPVCGTTLRNGVLVTVGVQNTNNCFVDYHNSRDGYGHGTFMAGAIWNNFTDADTGVFMGVAPDANILSVRVLDAQGVGSYETLIKGIQYVVENKDTFNIRVLNLSLSADVSSPYFVDPLNRAVEAAWAQGITVITAAGNTGPSAETITVPGNDPYVITVGAINGNRTAGYWADDFVPVYSSTGPTPDAFVKPDVLAPGSHVVSFMYNNPSDLQNSALLALNHPDYSENSSLFRMSGTSISSALTAGVAALMLQANPGLTPDQVKFRLKYSARPAVAGANELVYNMFQQGNGRVWAPSAVLGSFPTEDRDNQGMDLPADLAHGWDINGDDIPDESELAYHYMGQIERAISDDGQVYLYYTTNPDQTVTALGAARAADMSWMDIDAFNTSGSFSWNQGQLVWPDTFVWGGGWSWASGWSWTGKRPRTSSDLTNADYWYWNASDFWGSSGTWSSGWSWTGGKTRRSTMLTASGWSWTGGRTRKATTDPAETFLAPTLWVNE